MNKFMEIVKRRASIADELMNANKAQGKSLALKKKIANLETEDCLLRDTLKKMSQED